MASSLVRAGSAPSPPTRIEANLAGDLRHLATARLESKKRTTPGFTLALFIKSAITYFPAEQYHRRQELNFCVRDGNRCDPLPMVTDKSLRGLSASQGRIDA